MQLPSSCIARAAVMAAKLEADVNHRIKPGTVAENIPGSSLSCENSKPHTRYSSLLDSRRMGISSGAASHDLARALMELLLRIKSALNETNPANASSTLKDAKELAMELLTW